MGLFDRLTPSDKRKLAWGLGGAALIATGVALLGREKPKPKKRDYGIKINPLCSEWQVTDPVKLRAVQEEIYNRFIGQGITDPWTITSAFVGKIAPQCRRPTPAKRPGEMRNPGEAVFFYSAFVDTLCFLVDRHALSDEQAIAQARTAQGWAITQGVEPNDPALADPACAQGAVGEGEKPPQWLECTPPTVPMQIEGVWECRCPNGQPPQLVEQQGMMVPVC